MTPVCWKHAARAAAVAVVMSLSILVPPGSADQPEKFTNLKVLPKDISHDELTATMRGFTAALGVHCNYCHAQPSGQPNAEPDWPSDAKPEKATARLMMKMTRALNTETLANLPTKHADRIEVQCRTCHRGQPRPVMIEDLLTASWHAGGMDSLAATYESLRKKYYGSDTYNFGETMLPRLGDRIGGRDHPDDALTLADYNIKWYPSSGVAYLLRGQMRARLGDRPGAMADLDKAVELDPELKGNAERVKNQMK